MLFYIKDLFNTKEMPTIEHQWSVCINVCLSPRINFNIVVVYNPSSRCTSIFYNNLKELFKGFKYSSEVIILGDFKINWMDNKSRKPLRELTAKFDFHQLNGPSHLTRNSQTLIDLIFSNKPD